MGSVSPCPHDRLGRVHDRERTALVASQRAARAQSVASVPGGSGARTIRDASWRTAVGRKLSTSGGRGEQRPRLGSGRRFGTHGGARLRRKHARSHRGVADYRARVDSVDRHEGRATSVHRGIGGERRGCDAAVSSPPGDTRLIVCARGPRFVSRIACVAGTGGPHRVGPLTALAGNAQCSGMG